MMGAELYTDVIPGAASADAQLRLKFIKIAEKHPARRNKRRKTGRQGWQALQTWKKEANMPISTYHKFPSGGCRMCAYHSLTLFGLLFPQPRRPVQPLQPQCKGLSAKA